MSSHRQSLRSTTGATVDDRLGSERARWAAGGATVTYDAPGNLIEQGSADLVFEVCGFLVNEPRTCKSGPRYLCIPGPEGRRMWPRA